MGGRGVRSGWERSEEGVGGVRSGCEGCEEWVGEE